MNLYVNWIQHGTVRYAACFTVSTVLFFTASLLNSIHLLELMHPTLVPENYSVMHSMSLHWITVSHKLKGYRWAPMASYTGIIGPVLVVTCISPMHPCWESGPQSHLFVRIHRRLRISVDLLQLCQVFTVFPRIRRTNTPGFPRKRPDLTVFQPTTTLQIDNFTINKIQRQSHWHAQCVFLISSFLTYISSYRKPVTAVKFRRSVFDMTDDFVNCLLLHTTWNQGCDESDMILLACKTSKLQDTMKVCHDCPPLSHSASLSISDLLQPCLVSTALTGLFPDNQPQWFLQN